MKRWSCTPPYAAACLYHIAPLAGSELALQHQLVLVLDRRNNGDNSHAVNSAMPGLALRRLPEAQPAASALGHPHKSAFMLECATNTYSRSIGVSRYVILCEARSQRSTMLCPNAQAVPSCLVLVLREHKGSQQHFNVSEPVPSLQPRKRVTVAHRDALQSQPSEATGPKVILAQYLSAHVTSGEVRGTLSYFTHSTLFLPWLHKDSKSTACISRAQLRLKWLEFILPFLTNARAGPSAVLPVQAVPAFIQASCHLQAHHTPQKAEALHNVWPRRRHFLSR